MNIHNLIRAFLLALGCSWRETNGIITVVTPGNKVWDFTMPQEKI